MNLKKLLKGGMVVAVAASMAACGSSNNGSSAKIIHPQTALQTQQVQSNLVFQDH